MRNGDGPSHRFRVSGSNREQERLPGFGGVEDRGALTSGIRSSGASSLVQEEDAYYRDRRPNIKQSQRSRRKDRGKGTGSRVEVAGVLTQGHGQANGDEACHREDDQPLRPEHSEMPIIPLRHIPTATEDGESSVVEDWNETLQFPEGTGAETPVGRGTTGRRHRRRWTRRPAWMDHAPFLTAARRYLRDVRAFYRESTLERYGRDLRTVFRDLQALGVGTTPAKLREDHIKALLLRWQTRTTARAGSMEAASQRPGVPCSKRPRKSR